MSNQRNNSGMQLSGSEWLDNHHLAKKDMRYTFAKKISLKEPTSIIDIGCGTGLWLSIFNEILPTNCKFIGVDIDDNSLEEAKERSQFWKRECEWIKIDINSHPNKIPPADLALVFNFSSYIEDLDKFFSHISKERGFNKIVLRQFAGDEIKFGPFSVEEQTEIDLSIKNSIVASNQIRYYDMDRLIKSASKTGRTVDFREFELFQNFAPFSNTTWPYIKGTAEWTLERVSNKNKDLIKEWIDNARTSNSAYFYSLDWTALLN